MGMIGSHVGSNGARVLRAPFARYKLDPEGYDGRKRRQWFRAEHIGIDGAVSRGDHVSRQRGDRLAKAMELTREASAYRTAPDGTLDRKAVQRHTLAADIRRTTGDMASAVENYVALVRHHLAKQVPDRMAAIAFMRKAMACADLSNCSKARRSAYRQAAIVYLAVERPLTAYRILAELGEARGARPAEAVLSYGPPELADVVADAASAMRFESARCACGKHGEGPQGRPLQYLECCGIADRYPAEFEVRVEASGHWLDAGRWRYGTQSTLEALMRDQGRSPGAKHWVSWQTTRGRHELNAFPNWSGHALEAARTMATFSLLDPNGTAGPASAVLQAVCAVEAFLNTVDFAIAQDKFEAVDHWGKTVDGPSDDGATPVGEAPTNLSEQQQRSPRDGRGLVVRYQDSWRQLFGVDYQERLLPSDTADERGEFDLSWTIRTDGTPRLDGLGTLLEVRNRLTHARIAKFETLAPMRTEIRNDFPGVPGTVHFRHEPIPELERVLTPSFANWAATLAHDVIRAMRYEWRHHTETAAIEERIDDEPNWSDEEDLCCDCD